MTIRALILLAFVFGAVIPCAAAQASSKVVKFKTGESVYKIKQGSSVRISVILDIDSGYHVNSNRPAQDFLVATALKLTRTPGLSAGPVTYPKPKSRKFTFSPTPMSVYEGKATLMVTARALPSVAPGNYTLRGKLTVQACNDQACLRPETIDVEIPVEVLPKA